MKNMVPAHLTMQNLIACMMLSEALCVPACAQSCDYGECISYPATTIIDARQEKIAEIELRFAKIGGYELKDGRFQSFSEWYAGNMITTLVDFVTLFTSRFGLLWGASTGETAQKYNLQPAARIGLIALTPIGANARLSLSAHATIAGRLRERPCTADYGDVGGVQKVNCRLAAGELPPQETLKHLWNIPRPDQMQITARLTLGF